jgi:predicted alpha-1,6-mannanase (GH76 family)
LEPFLAGVITLLFDDSHNAISKARKAYHQLVLNESHNIHANQQKIEEAHCEIKKS